MHRRDFVRTVATMLTGPVFFGPSTVLAFLPGSTKNLLSFKILHTFPHDPDAFTQGLLFHEGLLYESTGGWGTSSLRKVELETGRVLQKRNLPHNYFGEGLALWEDRLIQLTWRSGTGFVYDLAGLEQQGTFLYSGEGWGLTGDEQGLIMSDGTSWLRRLDGRTCGELSRFAVFDQGRPLSGLNELEYIDGEIWANVFPTKRIARIDPESGQVTGWLDLSGVLGIRRRLPPEAVANGIAWDQHEQRIFVTGKLWPVLFEIEITAAPLNTDRARE
ncbi:MAG TPA: glutaminyl-peptide cyclotransferase [Desulfonatronum sp.]|nr:glutaminyl-peptide cyclotransferase [Desulfonatronum sp.]